MKQYEFAITHKVTGVPDQVRATANSSLTAYTAIVDYYGANFNVAEQPHKVREPHAVLGEVDCT